MLHDIIVRLWIAALYMLGARYAASAEHRWRTYRAGDWSAIVSDLTWSVLTFYLAGSIK